MNKTEYDRMMQRRRALLELMEGDFAPLETVPVPEYVQCTEWFRDFSLGEILLTMGLCCFRFKGLSGKVVAAFKILLEEEANGSLADRPILVAATSGNFGFAMAILLVSLSKVFDVRGFIAVVESTTSKGKLAHLHRSGAQVLIAPEGMTAIEYADIVGKQPGHRAINQYTHPGNLHGQEWVARKIYRELGNEVSIFAAAVGSTASVVGAHTYLRPLVPHLKVIGMGSMSEAEKVPGSRTEEGLRVTGFDYRSALDYPLITNVSKCEAFADSDGLISSSISGGATSGLVRAGFYKFLRQECEANRLDVLRNPNGDIVAVFLFMDMFLPYSMEYDQVLGTA